MVTIPDTDLECQWRILGLGLTHMSRLGIVAGSKRPTPALEFAWDFDNSPKSRKVWSYQELDDRANQVAHMIQVNGAKSGDIVAGVLVLVRLFPLTVTSVLDRVRFPSGMKDLTDQIHDMGL